MSFSIKSFVLLAVYFELLNMIEYSQGIYLPRCYVVSCATVKR